MTHHIAFRLFAFLTLLLLAQCSSSEPNIPAVGQSFCMDMDLDGVAGYYTRDSSDSDQEMQNLALITCDAVEYDCADDDAARAPGKIEIIGNTIDENCDDEATLDSSVENAAGVSTDCTDGTAFITYYLDTDLDGYGGSTALAACGALPTGYASTSTDCDDADGAIHPGVTDSLDDGIDQDCSGADAVACEDSEKKHWFLDADGDGHRAPTATVWDCTRPTGNYYLADETESDCDDTRIEVNQGVEFDYGYVVHQRAPNLISTTKTKPEESLPTSTASSTMPDPPIIITVNYLGIDNNCDGHTDEDGEKFSHTKFPEITNLIPEYTLTDSQGPGVYFDVCDGQGAFIYYTDTDSDGYGAARTLQYLCRQTTDDSDLVMNNTDCDDATINISPGIVNDYSNYMGALIGYNDIDNNCNGPIDEDGYEKTNGVLNTAYAWIGHSFQALEKKLSTTHTQMGSWLVDKIIDTSEDSDAPPSTIRTGFMYYHGDGSLTDSGYTAKKYFTKLEVNSTFGKFWHNAIEITSNGYAGTAVISDDNTDNTKIDAFSCNADDFCTGVIQIDLSSNDSTDQKFDAAYWTGRKALPYLRGYSFEYTDGVKTALKNQYIHLCTNDEIECSDAAPEIIPEDGIIRFRFQTKINGNSTVTPVTIKLHLSLLIYDPSYIQPVLFDFENEKTLSQDVSFNFKGAQTSLGEITNIDAIGNVSSAATTVGVLSRSFGFESDALGFPINTLEAVSFISNFTTDTNGSINIELKAAGDASGTVQITNSFAPDLIYELEPNKMQSVVLVCKNTDVCEMSFDTEAYNKTEYSGFGLSSED